MLTTTSLLFSIFFFFNDTATTEIYTLSLHDALPIYRAFHHVGMWTMLGDESLQVRLRGSCGRSEEHTSELQSLAYLVCRLLLEKKKNIDSFIPALKIVGTTVPIPCIQLRCRPLAQSH